MSQKVPKLHLVKTPLLQRVEGELQAGWKIYLQQHPTVGRQKKITERMKIKETIMSPEDITVIDSSSENSSPEAKTKKPGETRRSSTEQKKGKSYLGMEFDPEFAPKDPHDSSEKRIHGHLRICSFSGLVETVTQSTRAEKIEREKNVVKFAQQAIGDFSKVSGQNKSKDYWSVSKKTFIG